MHLKQNYCVDYGYVIYIILYYIYIKEYIYIFDKNFKTRIFKSIENDETDLCYVTLQS